MASITYSDEVQERPPPRPSLPKITCPICKHEFLELLYSSHVTSHYNEILPGWLYLGAERNAKEIWNTNKDKFTHVFCVAEEVPQHNNEAEVTGGVNKELATIKRSWSRVKIGEIYQYHVAIRDLPGEELHVFSEIADEINRIKEEADANEDCSLKMLVHCVQGISRSTTVVLSYLIKYHGMNLKQSYDFVRERRSIARPRKEFIEELQDIERKVFGFDKPTLLVEETLVGSIVVNVDPKR